MNIKIYNSAKAELDKLLNISQELRYIRVFVRTISL